MSVGGIMECYNKPLEIYNYETLKDDPSSTWIPSA